MEDVLSVNDQERLPESIRNRLHGCFENCIERQFAQDTSLVNVGSTKGPFIELLVYEDGTYDFAVSEVGFDNVFLTSKGDVGRPEGEDVVDGEITVEIAMRNCLDMPVCIHELGGQASWTALVDDMETGHQYIVEEGIKGLVWSQDTQSIEYWNDELYTNATQSIASAFLAGSWDLSRNNFIVRGNTEFIYIDHDPARRMDLSNFQSKKHIPQKLWEDTIPMIHEMAESVLGDDCDFSHVLDGREELVRANCLDAVSYLS